MIHSVRARPLLPCPPRPSQTPARPRAISPPRVARPELRAFYRVIYEKPRDVEEWALFRYLYGAELLFDPTLVDPRARPRAAVRVPGIVLHNDVDEDPRIYVGARNPALAHRELCRRYSDKLEEQALLARAVPELAVPVIRGDVLWSELGLERTPASLRRLEKHLRERFGRYILKPRRGFGSDGQLPTHEHDLAALWRSHLREVIPARAKIFRETADADARVERLAEELERPESLVLELLLSDPREVLVQAFIEHRDELRVHVVEGRILEGATTKRWWNGSSFIDPRAARDAELAVSKLLEAVGPISCAPDLLIAKNGALKLIDLNPGLDSGMYQPESDLYITNLLAARFRGRETDYLRDLRRLTEAPLAQKLDHVRALEARVGAFVREHEAFGFHDRIAAAYLEDLARAPTPDRRAEATRHLAAIEGIDAADRRRIRNYDLDSRAQP